MRLTLSQIAQFPAPARVGIFLVSLVLIWLPLAAPIYFLGGADPRVGTGLMLLLYGEFVFLLRVWGQNVHRQSYPFNYYGLEGDRRNRLNLVKGLGLGLISLVTLFGLEGALGWLTWNSVELSLLKIVIEGLSLALAVGLAEELLFRGWLLDELERDYGAELSLGLCSLLFALSHFLKPLAVILQTWPQFFGLLLLGMALIWAKRLCQGRLGLAIGLHAGLVWGYYIIDVADLVTYSDQVPEVITGVNDNPLAGLTGLVFLGAIAVGLGALTRRQSLRESEIH